MPPPTVDVLVAGGGPVGLTAAAELRRHGATCRIVDRLEAPPQYAKAVGVQPRTLEVWEDMGLLDAALGEVTAFNGQIVFVNGKEVARLELELPPEVPFGFVALPQYATERLLARHLAALGTEVERPVELRSFEQDEQGVTAVLAGPDGEESVRARYLVGADGAHSTVRKSLGLSFEGDAFPEEYMLGDVEVDWSFPPGMAIRSLHQTDGETDDVLVCIPLPGRRRYRMSMLVSPDLASSAAGGVEHGLEDRPGPTLAHIQAVLDRLAPERTTASSLRWSSVFRISHRLASRYGVGRVLIAGDAAHIHPPTGAQGMNTGIQDAYNLAWKVALACRGEAAAGLVDTYHLERHPVGEEVVGRTVRHARGGFEGDPDDPQTVLLREAQLLVGYPESPLVDGRGSFAGGPPPGARAPDVRGLERDGVNGPVRLLEVLRGPEHVLLLFSDGDPDGLDALAARARERAHGRLRAFAVMPAEGPRSPLATPVLRDPAGALAAAYSAPAGSAYLVRPDGYVGFRQTERDPDALVAHLGRTFA
jgi:2-polyprenyl-6-methoxyphenol hydroxylase-like FAD-dependent oxidoreductase